eukprot:8257512-Pyramimonas_sp.AAC.1
MASGRPVDSQGSYPDGKRDCFFFRACEDLPVRRRLRWKKNSRPSFARSETRAGARAAGRFPPMGPFPRA